ncbi:hypothetical protein D3874_20730 [Oleomonas cavernae]|uniref:Tetratricopeptide repeat protein n=1 Tax=Oleomonas cavernae TaxID=2320859 RepID=A0A418WGK0_9PROT|nr:hypothetical protein [Oleomonas cavernae]RJF89102.1 hypothetical protein D3874_20730 [Oleomonas cavernae]
MYRLLLSSGRAGLAALGLVVAASVSFGPNAPAAAAVTATNMVEAALVSASQIADVNERGLVISTIAEERAKAGDWAMVDRIVAGIDDVAVRDDALTQVALIAAGKGEAERALGLAARVTDMDGRGDATAAIAAALVRQGSVSAGQALARAVEDPEQRFRALVDVARAMATRRDPAAGRALDDALTSLNLIVDAGLSARMRQTAAQAAVMMGDVPRALAITDGLDDAARRLQVLRNAALGFARVGEKAGAVAAADQALEHLADAPDAREQAFILLDLGTALGLAGDQDRARQAFAGAVEAVRGLTPETAGEIEGFVAGAAIDGGLTGFGIEAARGLTEPVVRDIALRGAVAALVAAGRLTEARAIADEIKDGQVRDAALQALVNGAAEAGDTTLAAQAAAAIAGQQARQSATGTIAERQARAGDVAGAFEALARMAESPEREDVALELASVFADSGDVAAVTRAVADVQSTENREIGAANLALAQLSAGNVGAALEAARGLAEPTLRALVLARIATRLGDGTLPDAVPLAPPQAE